MALTAEDLMEMVELMFQAGWTDGLPVIPPTRELVDRFVGYLGRSPAEIIGEITPLGGVATLELVAANAVIAGCKP